MKATNPKDILGAMKAPLSLIPVVAKFWQALAHLDGALKYGLWNWRKAGVRASVYLDAMERHHARFLEGEWFAPDSGIPHLAHIAACCNILMDAHAAGMLIDDRPPSVDVAALFDGATQQIAAMRAKYDGVNPRHFTIADGPAGLDSLPVVGGEQLRVADWQPGDLGSRKEAA